MITHVAKSIPAFFYQLISKHLFTFILLQFLFFTWAFDHTFWPYILMMVIDTITHFQGDRSTLWSALSTPIFLGLALLIYIEVTNRVAGFMMARLFPAIEADARLSLFDYVQYHSFSYFSSHLAGSLANRIAEMPMCISRILQLVMALFAPVALALLISLAFFAAVQMAFAAILAIWMTLHIGICLAFAKRCDRYAEIHAEARSSLAGKIVDSLTNSLNVRLFARHPYEFVLLKRAQEDEQSKHYESLKYIEKMKMALGIVYFIFVGIILNGYMLWSWQKELITTGELVFIFNTSWNIGMMAWTAGLEIPTFFKELGTCRQCLSIVQDVHDVVDVPAAPPLRISHGEIVFDNVGFSYQRGRQLFRNLCVRIPAKQKVGLVGFSGSGKSTFVNLILRYFNIQEGSIRIDGQDIATVTQETLRSQIAMIPQDTALFHRSLYDNIHYGRLEATPDEVLLASKLAHCQDFVEKMPEKYSALVGEKGVKLSGGQRQRIAMARAILKEAPILILDEATSSLDSVTEQKIQEGLNWLMQDRTTILIAHRLSTLSGMDRILVFKEGRIIEDGSHEELLDAGGYYSELWEMQAAGLLLNEDDEEYDEEYSDP